VDDKWCSPNPEAASALLARATVPWWFAGGWAIDLFLNGTYRCHSDLDLGCFRADLPHLLRELEGWDVRAAAGGRLTPLAGASLDETAHGLWCRPRGTSCWVLEILVEDGNGSDWVFRRDQRVRRSVNGILARTTSGLHYLRPEIQLLYKSKSPRPHDNSDFRTAWPSLDVDARSWLVTHLRMINPEHPWLDVMDAG
jgi:hypothetical protein